MTTLQEAARQALDALDRSSPDNRGVGWVKRHIDAKRALRQALEDEQQNKPVARSLTDELMDCVDRLGSEYDEVDPRVWDHLLAYAPKQQGEPVAWMFQHEETGLTEAVDVQQVEWGFEKNNPRWQKLFPLYIRPQPAARWVGLTDEDRQAVFESLPNALDGFLKLWGWLHFAKAVEAKLREKNAGAQARQPLTDARVAAIVANYCLNVGDWTRNGESVARAIERAHGIKEES